MRKNKFADKAFAVICTAVLVFALFTIGTRFIVRQILVERMEIDNRLTRFIFFDNEDLRTVPRKKGTENNETIKINWAELYPFLPDDIVSQESEKNNLPPHKSSAPDRIMNMIHNIKASIEFYSSDGLIGYSYLTFLSHSYNSGVLWNFTPFSEYNNIVKLGKNYFYGPVDEKDVSESAASAISLSAFCKERDINFLYVQMPSKISKYEDTDISGITDFSNQNADAFLTIIQEAGVCTLDLREEIADDNLSHRDLFFETDHHWKGETGLWASAKILEAFNTLGLDTHPEILSPEKFNYVNYENWFLGSQGKKATLAQAAPENISLIYPKENTLFHYSIPDLKLDEIGDFSITYNMSSIETKDYMNANPYAAYNHADRPLIQIENMLCDTGERILIIHNSFANCVIPFLAIDIQYVDSLDLRHFTGSVKRFIEETDPNLVLVTYPCDAVGTVDYTTHTHVFDFR